MGRPPAVRDPLLAEDARSTVCGNIPNNLYEDELIPLFEKCGKIWDLR